MLRAAIDSGGATGATAALLLGVLAVTLIAATPWFVGFGAAVTAAAVWCASLDDQSD
jgi:hypothetical protein